jgi:hypothetical protein
MAAERVALDCRDPRVEQEGRLSSRGEKEQSADTFPRRGDARLLVHRLTLRRAF